MSELVTFDMVDPANIRRSVCGQYLIVKVPSPDGPRYQLWQHFLCAPGLESAAEAIRIARTLEADRLQALRTQLDQERAAAQTTP